MNYNDEKKLRECLLAFLLFYQLNDQLMKVAILRFQ